MFIVSNQKEESISKQRVNHIADCFKADPAEIPDRVVSHLSLQCLLK